MEPNDDLPDHGQARPHTVTSLAADLSTLGVEAGGLLLVHASVKSLGFVVGGLQAVVDALLLALGPAGTLVVPTHVPENSDPAQWSRPPVPEPWWPTIRDEAPGYDPRLTPAGRWLGRLPEAVRTRPGAHRSSHPHVSFAALGADAEAILRTHRQDDALGDSSPLGELYRRDGSVLLLGVGHDANTSLHLAEYRWPGARPVPHGAAVRDPDGRSRWVSWTDLDPDADDFAALGADLEADTDLVRVGPVGEATARLMHQPPVVDYAADWLTRHR